MLTTLRAEELMQSVFTESNLKIMRVGFESIE